MTSLLTVRMKALSVQQPWAWLIVNGIKDIENRTRFFKHRGPLAIHAPQAFDDAGYNRVYAEHPELRARMPLARHFSRGGIVGVVFVTDCTMESTSRWAERGFYQYVLEGAKAVEFQPCKGALNLFSVDVEVPVDLADKILGE